MHRIIQPDAVGSTLVTIRATFMGVGAVQTAGITRASGPIPGSTVALYWYIRCAASDHLVIS
jgi:hypothetical protein